MFPKMEWAMFDGRQFLILRNEQEGESNVLEETFT